MPNYNKCIFIGHLCRDPETSYAASGWQVARITVAANHKYNDREEVCFLPCVAFGKTAELIGQYFRKGDAIMLEGRLMTSQWQDKDTGENRSRTEMVVEKLTFLGRSEQSPPEDDKPRQKRGGTRGKSTSRRESTARGRNNENARPTRNEEYSEDYYPPDDEIPF